MNDLGAWKVDIFKHQASHTNGTIVTFENNEVTNIDNLAPSVNVHDIAALMKSAVVAYKHALEKRPRKPILKLKKKANTL